jgi:hypothetical protein
MTSINAAISPPGSLVAPVQSTSLLQENIANAVNASLKMLSFTGDLSEADLHKVAGVITRQVTDGLKSLSETDSHVIADRLNSIFVRSNLVALFERSHAR